MSSNEVSTKVTHHLDVLGFYCPVPLHEMKKGLEQLNFGDVMQVIQAKTILVMTMIHLEFLMLKQC